MAINLLEPEAIAGKVDHLYRHDAESLVWVLVWVCVRYEGGELLSKGRPLDEWLKVDAAACRKEKSDFVLRSQQKTFPVKPTSSHESNWDIALSLLDCVHDTFPRHRKVEVVLDDKSVFETWFEANVKSSLPT
ncbi:hypothetical protein DFH29DRAFT_964208 [Suillus ampliporus]|nr:hypothetical protein DFH29DRAFT_964208 [Suillus ampliporus]